jgi:hypothetical protein
MYLCILGIDVTSNAYCSALEMEASLLKKCVARTCADVQ